MVKLRTILLSSLFIGFAFYFNSCTGSDLFDEEVDPYPNKTITGKVTLQGETDYSNVYVWMDGINFGTLTNSKGEFKISLPNSYQRKGISKQTIYYFLSNFVLKTSTVSIKDGYFEYGVESLNRDGNINSTIEMQRAFEFYLEKPIKYNEPFLNLRILQNATVYFPYSSVIQIGLESYYATANYFYKNSSGIQMSTLQPSNYLQLELTKGTIFKIRLDLSLFEYENLTHGEYKLMPMIYGIQNIPQEMKNSMLPDFSDFNRFNSYYHRLNWITFNWSGTVAQ